MPRARSVFNALAGLAAAVALAGPGGGSVVSAQSDLDAFMQRVMARRDDNWKKLQQYILDEREEIDFRGPARIPLWGERRDFTWFVRDGFFVRSPVKVNGAAVGEDDRRKYEADYLNQQREREKRRQERDQKARENAPNAGADAPAQSALAAPDASSPLQAAQGDLEGFIRQTRRPEFISSAYFMNFKFDSGRYALVAREQLDGREVLRVEYYPTKLFTDNERNRERRPRQGKPESRAVDETVNRLMNKGSRVTLWIEPAAQQIVQYTFDNVNFDFFPAQWLASVTGAHASMTMTQPFAEVWLPHDLRMQVGLMLAIGELNFEYSLVYHDYRKADVTAVMRVPGAR